MKRLLLALAALLLWTAALPRLAAADRPNILFVLADDLGYGDLGCYNPESKVPTPNLDALAREGMRLTDAHSPSAVCTPTRYGVLTGRYCWRTRLKRGVLVGDSKLLIDPERETVARFLQRQGYATAAFGKWHLGFSNEQPVDFTKSLKPGANEVGFDHFFGIPASLDFQPYVYVENDRAVQPPTERIAASGQRRRGGDGFWRAGGIAPDFKHIDVLPRITAEAIAYLERHAQEQPQQPFFVYLPLNSPHTPWLPTKEFVGKSQAGPYGDFVVQSDHCIGRVLKTLDRLGWADNTLVIVTSDNGAHWLPSDIDKYGHRANGALRGQKADIHEGGHRVPFIARWPGKIAPGSRSAALACHTDLFATCADLIDKPIPAGAAEDSVSLLPALLSEKDAGREQVVHHSVSGMFAIRQGDWKLIEGLGSGGFTPPRNVKPKPGQPRGQLYNLADDPAETTNLWEREPERVAELLKQLGEVRGRQ